MAVYGYFPVASGQTLTSKHMNGVAGQTIMRFANAGTRGSALGASTVSKGMVSYLDDVSRLESYNGSAWVSFGVATGGYYTILRAPSTAITLTAGAAKHQVVFNPAADSNVPVASAPGYQDFPTANITNAGVTVPLSGMWYIGAHAGFGGQADGGEYTLEFTVNTTLKTYGLTMPGVVGRNINMIYPAMYPMVMGQTIGIQVSAVGQSGTFLGGSILVSGPF